ncbi:hypothetical protein SLA2020_352460 [Shorea laevis]
MREITSIERNAKTIKTKYEERYDCVYIYKQPAFEHHLLKDHEIQMRPNNFSGQRFAGIGTKFQPGRLYHGAGRFVSIWNPTVSPGQFSATAVSINGGPPDQFSVIRVGWIVDRAMFYDNNTHLYTIWGYVSLSLFLIFVKNED